MDDQGAARRTVLVLTLGARFCLLVGVLLLIVSGYLYWSPLEKPTKQGIPFGCGTAANPPTEQFPKTVCGKANDRRKLQAGAFLLSALVVGAGGVLVFGASRRDEHAVGSSSSAPES